MSFYYLLLDRFFSLTCFGNNTSQSCEYEVNFGIFRFSILNFYIFTKYGNILIIFQTIGSFKQINMLFPPKFNHHFDFADSEDFQQSDYEDSLSQSIGTHSFRPLWKTVTFQNKENYNCFCPYCGKYVEENIQNFGCTIQSTDKLCLAHQECIGQKQNISMQFQYTKSQYSLSKGYLKMDGLSSKLGGKEYILSSKIQHPLSSYKYLNMDSRIIMNEGQIFLTLESQTNQIDAFRPNIVVVPLPQMNIKLNLRQISCENQTEQLNFNIDISQIFVGLQVTEKQSVWVISFEDSNLWTVKLQISLVFDRNLKRKLVQAMNFKYKHSLIDIIPLVQINKILVQLKHYENGQAKSNIENTKASSNYEDIYEEEQLDTISNSRGEHIFIPITVTQPKNQQLDIRKFSKTQTGSKELQKKLKEMKTDKLNSFIAEISPYLFELLEDDYANYMIQTLVSLSNSQQRLKIFNVLKDSIPQIVSLKQGTFAFQQMISFIQTQEEYALFSEVMAIKFLQIATNSNGNHFLRKLIPLLPLYYKEILFKPIFENFIELANDKNSVCVLKVMLRAIASENPSQKSKELKKKMIDLLTINSEKIIKNEFGNYFIQEAFQIFGEQQLRGISEFVFNKFKNLSKQKFSSSVICKCISSYWRNTNYYERLKSKLTHNQILQLYRNKEGNKVLLELVSNGCDFTLRNKISSVISNELPSKFNSNKWISSTGSKTGRVGNENYSNFSQALNDYDYKNNPMAKKNLYNIH